MFVIYSNFWIFRSGRTTTRTLKIDRKGGTQKTEVEHVKTEGENVIKIGNLIIALKEKIDHEHKRNM